MNIYLADRDDLLRRFEDAAAAYFAGRFQEAAAGFTALVDLSYPPAATSLGNMYLRGEAGPPDPGEGLRLLDLAVSWGDPTAAYNLGTLYRSGDNGVTPDPAASKRYLAIAHALGCEVPAEEMVLEPPTSRRRRIKWAWQFRCAHSLGELETLCNRLGPWRWEPAESSWFGEYLDARPSHGVRLRIHRFAPQVYVSQLELAPDLADALEGVDAAFRRLLSGVGAMTVVRCEPYD